jgi:hypothetical protein
MSTVNQAALTEEWINEVLKPHRSLFTRSEIVDMMLDKLRQDADYRRHFLATGAGKLDVVNKRPVLRTFRGGFTLWSIMDDDAFRKAVNICAELSPALLFLEGSAITQPFGIAEQLDARLDQPTLQDTLAGVAEHLTSLEGVGFGGLRLMRTADLVALAERLVESVTLDVVVPVSFRLPLVEARTFIAAMQPAFQRNIIDNYRQHIIAIEKHPKSAHAGMLRLELHNALKKAGVLLIKTTKVNWQGTQTIVAKHPHRGKTYFVQFAMQMSMYVPGNGTWVLIDPDTASRARNERLNGTTAVVREAWFIPARSMQAYH